MSYTVTQESFDSLTSYWADSSLRLKWGSVFSLPSWLKVWWREFKPGTELYLVSVRQQTEIIGIAPLQTKEGEASFIGSADVCDYLDFVTVLGREDEFFNALFDDLKIQNINRLELRSVRPDSTVVTNLANVARSRGLEVLHQKEGLSLELDLPATWDEYLAGLSKKQRHEVKRKLRRLWGAGNVNYRCLQASPEEAGALTDTFLKLFPLSREDKADFMTIRMQSFFRSLTETMAEIKLLRYGLLEVDAQAAAMIMGFDYNDTMYLYNSAFDPQYDSLSVGLLSKVLCIKESIARGMKRWDFLKGTERYKYELGGNEVPLYNYRITIK
ncbi:GNAT family N-acetyltransferase [Chloroflexota bacterium]